MMRFTSATSRFLADGPNAIVNERQAQPPTRANSGPIQRSAWKENSPKLNFGYTEF
jgi:hypothetical protein